MPRKLIQVPDLTGYTSFNDYLSTPGNPKISEGTYYNRRAAQLQLPKPQNQTIDNTARSIVYVNNNNGDSYNSLDNKVDKKEGSNTESRTELKPSDRQEIIEKSIWSIKKHAPTQWQCAMTALERLLPQQFAKRDPSNAVANTVGIRITIGAREQGYNAGNITDGAIVDVARNQTVNQ
jgi:hypothetical protein